MALWTVQGELRHALEAFIRNVPGQRGDVPWRDNRGNVLCHFLSTDEEAALRDMVEGQLVHVQEVGEAENVYARRYKEAAQRAYPVKYFLNGLHKSTLACDVIRIHDALEAFIRNVPGQRGDVPWRDNRGNVLRHFLSTDEEAALRDMVEGQLVHVQEVGEAENVYARRYKEAAQRAYPVKYFLNGLHKSTLACDVIRIHDPRTLDHAVDHVAVLCAREEAYQWLSRHQSHHEAMEVDAVQVTTGRLEKLEGAVVAVAEAVTKMASQRRDDVTPRRDNRGSERR